MECLSVGANRSQAQYNRSMTIRWGDLSGRLAGVAFAPYFGIKAYRTRRRALHAAGIVVGAKVRSCARSEPWVGLAKRLEGRAIVRFSGALSDNEERRDILGVAFRFTDAADWTEVEHISDQDLHLATLERVWSIREGFATTNVHDYLDNGYWSISPFYVGNHKVEWNVVANRTSPAGTHRDQRLRAASEAGGVRLTLRARPFREIWQEESKPMEPVVDLELGPALDLDTKRLRFNPFRNGKGIEPTGWLHGARVVPYRVAQWARNIAPSR